MTASFALMGASIRNGFDAGKLDAAQADRLLALWSRAQDDGGTVSQFICAAHQLGLMARPRSFPHQELWS